MSLVQRHGAIQGEALQLKKVLPKVRRLCHENSFFRLFCGPWPTSEPGNAWRIVNHALNEGHEVWTITEKSGYEKAMKEHLAKHAMPRYHPLFLKLSLPAAQLHRPGTLGGVYYHLWQQKLLSVARQLHQEIGFDLAQHITFGRYWSPSGIRNLGIPLFGARSEPQNRSPPPFWRNCPCASEPLSLSGMAFGHFPTPIRPYAIRQKKRPSPSG